MISRGGSMTKIESALNAGSNFRIKGRVSMQNSRTNTPQSFKTHFADNPYKPESKTTDLNSILISNRKHENKPISRSFSPKIHPMSRQQVERSRMEVRSFIDQSHTLINIATRSSKPYRPGVTHDDESVKMSIVKLHRKAKNEDDLWWKFKRLGANTAFQSCKFNWNVFKD
jgi:hypothetical protein